MPSDPSSADSNWGLFGGGLRRGPSHPPGLGDGAELDFDSDSKGAGQEVPTRPQRRLVTKPAPTHAAAAMPSEAAGPGMEAEEAAPPSKSPSARRVPLEKKPDDGIKVFTRFVTRPGASVAATTAVDQFSSEKFISPELAGGLPVFGKIRNHKEVELRPSRLHHVLLQAWTHSRLGWLDHLGALKTALIAFLLAGTLSLILWPYLKEVFRPRNSAAAVELAPAAPMAPDAVRQAAIRQSFEAYRATPQIAEKLRWVLEPQRVELRMKDFYETQGQQDPTISSYQVGPPVRAGAGWWFVLTCATVDGQALSVLMKESPEGGQLDWENFVAYGSMPWEKFTTGRPAAPQTMRARLRRSSLFSGKYLPGDYFAFEVSHRSSPEVLMGYVPKSSRSGQALAGGSGLEDWLPNNLYLSWESDAGSPKAVLIGDLIRNNWLDGLGDNPAGQRSAFPAEKPAPQPASIP